MSIYTFDLRFPIGPHLYQGSESQEEIQRWIEQIADHPGALKAILRKVPEHALSWRYRPNGWTVRQVIHHMADSHMNSIIRFKLALTEDRPTIKTYDERRWVELPDTVNQDIQDSVYILEGVHSRLGNLLRSLDADDLERSLYHPEHKREINLKEFVSLYAWHGRHHNAHILQALESKGRYN